MIDSEKIQEAKSLLSELKHAWVSQDVESTNAHARKIEALEYVIQQAERVDGLIKVKKVLAEKLHAERHKNNQYVQALERVRSLSSYEGSDVVIFSLVDRTLMKGAEPNVAYSEKSK